jgi:hypothetical protein
MPVTSINGDLKPEIVKEMRARLLVAEQEMPLTSRFCKGDASETGLV